MHVSLQNQGPAPLLAVNTEMLLKANKQQTFKSHNKADKYWF